MATGVSKLVVQGLHKAPHHQDIGIISWDMLKFGLDRNTVEDEKLRLGGM